MVTPRGGLLLMSEVPLYSPLTGCPGVSVTTGGEEVAFLPRVTFLEKVTFCVRVTFDDQGLAFLELAKMRPSTPACAFGVGGLGCVSLSHTLSLCLSHTLSLSHLPTLLSLCRSLSLINIRLQRARLGLEVCGRKTRLFGSAHPTRTCRWTEREI